jgi:2-polyprenyl-6-methoxyphenol hydroxylase-like FAD-dependent oxidoreductase
MRAARSALELFMVGRVLIIGGGIGGLAAALALYRVGVRATVFERAPAIREVGAGLTLWSNAVKALRQLGAADQVVSLGSVLEHSQTITPEGRLLNEQSVAALAREAGAPCILAHRADLQRTLLEALPAEEVHTGQQCVGVEEVDGHVVARFVGGREEHGDLLIGADGIRSVVREAVLGKSEPVYAGYTCWRGMASFHHPAFPPGLGFFLVGRGTQMGLFHCGPGRAYWFVTRNAPPGSLDGSGPHRQKVLDSFPVWPDTFRAAIEATDEAAIIPGDILDRDPSPVWGHGRITLLGDAIHATTPNLGQGACQALEDAVVLAHCLRTKVDGPQALREYEALRRDRTALVTRQSRSLGKMFQAQNLVAVWFRNWLFRTRFAHNRGLKLFHLLLSYDVPSLTRP